MIWFIFATVYLVLVTAFSFPVPDDSIYAMFPNERTSLNDCRSRYYRIDQVEYYHYTAGYGKSTRIGEFPHMAAIGWTQPNGTVLWECGGSLIWDNFVLTAAHCAYKSDIKAPDVVRLGDVDLQSSKDDHYVQYFQIDKIIRHPEHSYFKNYHDIALLKLDRNVVITENGNVIPACLWTDEEVKFQRLVVTGWGQIGFALEHSPKLLKVSLEPISSEKCNSFYPPFTRRLREGLKDQHLCARDEQMDTCGGDSGGPLQINLLHNSRMSPFIVGITSFGAACTRSVPGVYTRVATYYNWIINTMQSNGAIGLKDDYNETLCALRYAIYRKKPLKPATRIVTRNYPKQLVTIRWDGVGPDCAGVIVDEDTVLTVVDCTRYKGKSPSYISYLDNKTMPIAKIIIHPEHVHGSAYNNIAILKLKRLLDLPEHFIPSCINEILRGGDLTGYAKGRRDLNNFNVSTVTDSQQVDLAIEFDILNTSNCVISERFKPLMHDLDREHLCLGNDDFLVPGSCQQSTGSMLGSSSYDFYYTTHALTLSSRDCGFGEHLISTRIESHIDWLKSVLLPKYPCSRYIDPDLKEGDSCTLSSGLNGKCVSMNRCAIQMKQTQELVTMCSKNDVICCYIKPKIQFHPRILNCPKIVKKYSRNMQKNGSLVAIGWFGSKRTQFRCLGSIINRSFVLTTASCLRKTQPNVVRTMESSVVADINSILMHPKFNETDRTYDIALIRLKNPLRWSSSVNPICLWTNESVTPMYLDINNFTSNHRKAIPLAEIEQYISTSKKLHPMYNSDCQKAHRHTIPDSQLCTRSPYHSAACVTPSDQLIWMDTDTNVKYLVGMSTNACGPYKWKYNVFTRISAFVEWISKHAFYNKI